MLSFWRAIFYSSLLDPIFTAVASALGVTKQVCKEYCTSGVMEYGLTMLLIVLAVILVIVLIRVFGLLNGGNLSGKYNPESLETSFFWALPSPRALRPMASLSLT